MNKSTATETPRTETARTQHDAVEAPASSPLVEGAGCVGCVYGRVVALSRCCLLPPTPYTLAC